jgi:hypothetical protein
VDPVPSRTTGNLCWDSPASVSACETTPGRAYHTRATDWVSSFYRHHKKHMLHGIQRGALHNPYSSTALRSACVEFGATRMNCGQCNHRNVMLCEIEPSWRRWAEGSHEIAHSFARKGIEHSESLVRRKRIIEKVWWSCSATMKAAAIIGIRHKVRGG